MRLGDEGVQVMEWAYGRLLTLPGLAEALNVAPEAMDAVVVPNVAPPTGEGPWVVYSVAEALDVNGLGSQPRLMSAVPLLVKIVMQARSFDPIAPAARLIYGLHGAQSEPVTEGGIVLTVRRTATVQYPEVVDGIEYRHLGHSFQVEVN